ncbi:hypothetical protein [Nonomuraea turkmeniaca]|uniref:hypothetical protein n=1 Tax=Nonomuraea turkmeniaca TaxID=103838 RepID=UPI0014768822|nr:hypothetical protein [Nonomuraea turkmeniaca]
MAQHVFILQPIGSGCSRPSTYRWKCSCGAEGANPYMSESGAKRGHDEHAQAESG